MLRSPSCPPRNARSTPRVPEEHALSFAGVLTPGVSYLSRIWQDSLLTLITLAVRDVLESLLAGGPGEAQYQVVYGQPGWCPATATFSLPSLGHLCHRLCLMPLL